MDKLLRLPKKLECQLEDLEKVLVSGASYLKCMRKQKDNIYYNLRLPVSKIKVCGRAVTIYLIDQPRTYSNYTYCATKTSEICIQIKQLKPINWIEIRRILFHEVYHAYVENEIEEDGYKALPYKCTDEEWEEYSLQPEEIDAECCSFDYEIRNATLEEKYAIWLWAELPYTEKSKVFLPTSPVPDILYSPFWTFWLKHKNVTEKICKRLMASIGEIAI